MNVGVLGAKGGSGRSVSAQVLANGFALEGRETTLLEFVAPGHRRALVPKQTPGFNYLPITLEPSFSAAALAENIMKAGRTSDLVVDLPLLAPAEVITLQHALDLLVVPLHPDPVDLGAARSFLQALDAIQSGKPWPPLWVVHIDEIQSMRGSLSLVNLLVAGWPSATPPMIFPWTLPRFSRPQLGILTSGTPVSDTVASTCRIFALAARHMLSLGADELPLPGAFEEKLPEALKSRFRGEDRGLWEKLAGLATDVAAIHSGEGPRPSDLLSTPVLDDWSIEPFEARLLAGIVRGHPRLGGGPVRTTMAILVDEDEGWARTLSRFYRLGRKAKRRRPEAERDPGPQT